jgi:hypothetical protein
MTVRDLVEMLGNVRPDAYVFFFGGGDVAASIDAVGQGKHGVFLASIGAGIEIETGRRVWIEEPRKRGE